MTTNQINTIEISTFPDFESALSEIDEIVNKLESGALPLEQSLEAFQRGMELVNFCGQRLTAAESKLKILLEGASGEFKLKDAE